MKKRLTLTATFITVVLVAATAGADEADIESRDRYCYVLGDWCLPFPEWFAELAASRKSEGSDEAGNDARAGSVGGATTSSTTGAARSAEVIREMPADPP